MRPTRAHATLAALSLAAAVLLRPAPALAAAVTSTDNTQVPFSILVFVDCAASGAGELVELSGSLHILSHVTLDGSGGFRSKSHFQPQGVRGAGQTTGAKYQGAGVTQDQFVGKVGSTHTFINNFRIIGPGPGNNLTVHQNVHLTINARGVVTASVSNTRAACK